MTEMNHFYKTGFLKEWLVLQFKNKKAIYFLFVLVVKKLFMKGKEVRNESHFPLEISVEQFYLFTVLLMLR